MQYCAASECRQGRLAQHRCALTLHLPDSQEAGCVGAGARVGWSPPPSSCVPGCIPWEGSFPTPAAFTPTRARPSGLMRHRHQLYAATARDPRRVGVVRGGGGRRTAVLGEQDGEGGLLHHAAGVVLLAERLHRPAVRAVHIPRLRLVVLRPPGGPAIGPLQAPPATSCRPLPPTRALAIACYSGHVNYIPLAISTKPSDGRARGWAGGGAPTAPAASVQKGHWWSLRSTTPAEAVHGSVGRRSAFAVGPSVIPSL